jgi:mycoredoxin-dependent peroxiredoxin
VSRAPLQVGSSAPEFALPSAAGPLVTLSGLLASGAALVVFFPFAFSETCTVELDDIRDGLASFGGVSLVAVSCDPKFSLRMFAKWRGYRFPLLSDFWPHGAAASSYGVFDAVRGMSVRGTFLISTDGVIRFSEANEPGDVRAQDGWRSAIADLERPDGAISGSVES